MPIVQTYDALLSGHTWNGEDVSDRPVFLTYSFDATPAAYLSSRFDSSFLDSFQPFSDAEKATARQALKAWADASGITFFEAPAGQGDLRFGVYDVRLAPGFEGGSAFAFLPTTDISAQGGHERPLSGDIFIGVGEGDFVTIAHEIGHALGLKHPFEGDTTLDSAFDDQAHTVMTYNLGAPPVTALGTLDVLAVAELYGPASADGTQAGTWSWDPVGHVLTQTARTAGGAETLIGVATRDVITGGVAADVLFGRAGNDQLSGGGGDDTLSGGDGFDTLSGDAGDDVLDLGAGGGRMLGGAGEDLLVRTGGVVFADGGDGYDAYFDLTSIGGSQGVSLSYASLTAGGGGYVNFEIIGLYGSEGGDTLTGGLLPDILFGDAGADLISGAEGDDYIDGESGADSISGGAGDDEIDGGDGVGFIRGDEGDDWIVGGAVFDDMHGNMGNDTLYGGLGDDWVVGGKDNDRLYGEGGGDVVLGNLGADTCEGGAGNDIVRGGQADDWVLGGAGDDYVSGDRGADTVTGGAGADLFHTFGDAGLDRVTDFSLAQGDRVLVDPGTKYAIAQAGSDVVINMGGGGQMVLVGVQLSALSGDWIFGA